MKTILFSSAMMNFSFAAMPGNPAAAINLLVGCFCFGMFLAMAAYSTLDFAADVVERR